VICFVNMLRVIWQSRVIKAYVPHSSLWKSIHCFKSITTSLKEIHYGEYLIFFFNLFDIFCSQYVSKLSCHSTAQQVLPNFMHRTKARHKRIIDFFHIGKINSINTIESQEWALYAFINKTWSLLYFFKSSKIIIEFKLRVIIMNIKLFH